MRSYLRYGFKAHKKIRWLAVFLFAVVCWALFAAAAARTLIVELPLNKADGIVVLSGSASYKERVDEALLLYEAGVAPLIFLTNDGGQAGWNEAEQRNPYFFELARWRLVEHGVPDSSINVLPPMVEGTLDEAKVVVDAALRNGNTSLVIVTSPYHTRRALWTFERVASKSEKHLAFGIVPAKNLRESPRWCIWWVTASGWQTIPSEYLKFGYYCLRY